MGHFQQVHNSKVCNNKIYVKLDKTNVRDRILKGEFTWEECDNIEVCKFLKLLSTNNKGYTHPNTNEMSIVE